MERHRDQIRSLFHPSKPRIGDTAAPFDDFEPDDVAFDGAEPGGDEAQRAGPVGQPTLTR